MYQTRERTRQVLAHGISDIPEDATYNSIEQVSNICDLLYEEYYKSKQGTVANVMLMC